MEMDGVNLLVCVLLIISLWCEVRNKTVVWYGDQCAVGSALMNILLLIYVVREVYELKKYGVWFVTDKVPKMVK